MKPLKNGGLLGYLPTQDTNSIRILMNGMILLLVLLCIFYIIFKTNMHYLI